MQLHCGEKHWKGRANKYMKSKGTKATTRALVSHVKVAYRQDVQPPTHLFLLQVAHSYSTKDSKVSNI